MSAERRAEAKPVARNRFRNLQQGEVAAPVPPDDRRGAQLLTPALENDRASAVDYVLDGGNERRADEHACPDRPSLAGGGFDANDAALHPGDELAELGTCERRRRVDARPAAVQLRGQAPTRRRSVRRVVGFETVRERHGEEREAVRSADVASPHASRDAAGELAREARRRDPVPRGAAPSCEEHARLSSKRLDPVVGAHRPR